MQEKPRFAIALAGVGGCLCIAAGIVITVPRASAVPSVNGVPAHVPSGCRDCRCRRGLMWQPCRVCDQRHVRRPGGSRRRRRRTRRACAVDRAAGRGGDCRTGRAQSSIGNRQSSIPGAGDAQQPPQRRWQDVAEDRRRDRGPVTGALVTAGTHIGGGFRTVGRTLKKVF